VVERKRSSILRRRRLHRTTSGVAVGGRNNESTLCGHGHVVTGFAGGPWQDKTDLSFFVDASTDRGVMELEDPHRNFGET